MTSAETKLCRDIATLEGWKQRTLKECNVYMRGWSGWIDLGKLEDPREPTLEAVTVALTKMIEGDGDASD